MAEDTPPTGPDEGAGDAPDSHQPGGPEDGLDPGVDANPGTTTREMSIEQELADSYLTYAMSTIVDRALPDARDGLKPSQRRILVAMNDLNLTPGRKHSKCAGIVGETMKKYHPHGDQAIYPTLVNMAQEWKTRALLVDKQGNFGSIDPDPPAAMRYTEARLHPHAMEMLADLKLDTVDYQPNFDEQYHEPKVLPARLPNLLINGSTGIAVGMACSMPPHNLAEVCDAVTACIDNPDIELRELLEIIPGPDFPTGGSIMGRRGIAEAYATGRGRVTVRAKIEHEETKKGRDLLVVRQLPYQVTKNDGVIQKIIALRKQDKLTDISDVTDESSNRAGMRLVIELKRGTDPEAVLNQLYRLTPLQSTFSIINIALVHGQPRTLGIRELIQAHIDHRIEVIRRRTLHKLHQAQQEAHRLEGLIYAVCDIDEVIKLIRTSQSRDEAIERLMARGFRIPPDHPAAPKIPERLMAASAESDVRLTRTQAEAIGRLQLIQLVGLEIEQLVENYAKLVDQIEEFEAILASDERVLQIIKDDLADLKAKYADPRRTVLEEAEAGELDLADLTPVEQVAVTITHAGYVKRLPITEYRTQGRGGRGVIGAKAKEGDFTEKVFVASTHDDLLCFTNTGRVFKIKVFEIPEAPRTARGRAIVNLINLQPGESVREWMPISDFEKSETFLLFASQQGLVKRTALKDYRNVNKSGLIAVGLKDGDQLVGVEWTEGADHVILGTRRGMAIRFSESDARVMGRSAAGVKGIDLRDGDEVVGLIKVPCESGDDGEPTCKEGQLLTITERGYGKRTDTTEYLVQSEDGTTRLQSRGGKGRRDIAVTQRNGDVVGLLNVTPGDSLMLITFAGMIVRIQADTVRQTGRATQGVKLIDLKKSDRLVAMARVQEDESDEGEASSEE
ncbi:MAG: DNA gyrase subunit A [Phycisphaeraceae bacterium]